MNTDWKKNFREEILALPNYNMTVGEDIEALLTTQRAELAGKVKELYVKDMITDYEAAKISHIATYNGAIRAVLALLQEPTKDI